MSQSTDVSAIIIGGGVFGLSIAYGLARAGERIQILDEGDDAFRASRGNGGLVWVQSKGAGNHPYAHWTMASAKRWPSFAAELTERTGLDLELSQVGGLAFCLSEKDLLRRRDMLEAIRVGVGGDYPFEVLNHNSVREMVPEIGPDVVGATYSPMDGHVSPLRLLRALMKSCQMLGVATTSSVKVDRISYRNGLFYVKTDGAEHVAPKLVLAAGLGNIPLAPQVGLKAPIAPNRGQMLVTERLKPFLRYPCHEIRQTAEGVMQIGVSQEDVGFDDRTTVDELARICDEACRMFPLLEGVNIVRSWGALRPLTPDGIPIYQASQECPGAFIVTGHSGITLAAQHAGPLADWIRGGEEPPEITGFKAERFDGGIKQDQRNVQAH